MINRGRQLDPAIAWCNCTMSTSSTQHAPTAKTTSYVVGAYAASPAHGTWHPDLEEEFYSGLAAMPRVNALEIPWLGRLHPHDDQWILTHFPARFTAVVTGIGNVMSTADELGLASPDDDARNKALATTKKLLGDVRRFNDEVGRQVVSAVELHSAPRGTGTADALAAGLAEVATWDWDGAQLLVEHCDAFISGQAPEKGFLRLEDEIAAIRSSEAPVKISMNWGRCAIELRGGEQVAGQVGEAAASGLLDGIIFSGAADREGEAGYAWIDAHHAFRRSPQHPLGDPTSLLTEERVADALRATRSAGEDNAPQWLGVKVGWAHPAGTVAERLQMVADALDGVERAARS